MQVDTTSKFFVKKLKTKIKKKEETQLTRT